jgi:hypothetical protein
MESSFASLRKELIHHEDYATRGEARASIFESIEVFYRASAYFLDDREDHAGWRPAT